MQPTYLPWVGYFALIKNVDYFIFLDDVQYSKQSWQSRNKILISGKPEWLSIPVTRPNGLQTKILDVLVDDRENWRRIHCETLLANYGSHPYFKNISFIQDIIGDILIENISEININIIQSVANYLGIKSKFLRSSDLGIKASRSEKLYFLCKEVNADIYVSPPGAADYLKEDRFEYLYPIKLDFFSYDPKIYKQKSSNEFIEKLSIYDLLANCGADSGKFI
jgi:hypothetical protein